MPEEELAMVKEVMLGEMCRSYEDRHSPLADAWMFVQVSGFAITHFEDALERSPEILLLRDMHVELAGKAFVQREIKKKSYPAKKCHKKPRNRLVVLAD